MGLGAGWPGASGRGVLLGCDVALGPGCAGEVAVGGSKVGVGVGSSEVGVALGGSAVGEGVGLGGSVVGVGVSVGSSDVGEGVSAVTVTSTGVQVGNCAAA